MSSIRPLLIALALFVAVPTLWSAFDVPVGAAETASVLPAPTDASGAPICDLPDLARFEQSSPDPIALAPGVACESAPPAAIAEACRRAIAAHRSHCAAWCSAAFAGAQRCVGVSDATAARFTPDDPAHCASGPAPETARLACPVAGECHCVVPPTP